MRIRNFIFLIVLFSCSEQRSFEQVKKMHPSSFKEILDRKGRLLHETRVNFKEHRRSWTQIEDLPENFVSEIIRLEDKRFFSHLGFDPWAMIHAVKEYPKRGASTISMQVAGILEGQRGRRGILSKLLQIKEAVTLEMNWSKKEILEAWLNLIAFKGDLSGIRAASFALFGKDPRGLNFNERLILYAQIPSPNQSAKKILSRACRYAQALNKKCDGLSESLMTSTYFKPETRLLQNQAPHVAQLLHQDPKDKITTTIDRDLQEEASHLLRSHIRNLRVQNVQDGAVLVMEKESGNILAYVGSSGDFSASELVDHVRSRRQAGSTLKPFLYAAAISERLITMTSPLRDEPFSVTREGLTYQPENYQKGFTYQDVPAKVALGSSLNIPAVRVIDYLTPERFYQHLSDLEFKKLQDPDYYGHSMALGSVDVTLWDLVQAYGALGNNGSLVEPRLLENKKSVKKQVSLLTPQISFILGQILSEKNNRYLTFGIQSTLSTESWSAVKTGTSKDMRDNWCIGYTDRYVVGVWVGNSAGDPMWNVTGISGAAPIFSQLVSSLHKNRPSLSPLRPEGLVRLGDDFYLEGTEPKGGEEQKVLESSVAKILFPQNGAQFAFDPEIPEANQKVIFQSSGKDLKWKLNGVEIGKEFIPKKSGKYSLKLLDEFDTAKDEVTFFVKSGKSSL